MDLITLIESLKIIIAVSIFFVWVVRYQNIVEEFKKYDLPNWLRDLTGILKLSFAVMILKSNSNLIILGALGIIILMLAAQLTHLKVNTKIYARVPSLVLLSFSLVLVINNL